MSRGRFIGVAVLLGASVLAPPAAAAGPQSLQRLATAPAVWGASATAPFGVIAQLFGVTAKSGQAWAVGGANPTGAPPTQVLTDPYAERFDGTRWIATPVPPVTTYGTSRSVKLAGTTAVSTNDVWAVGSVEDLSSLASQTLAYHWNGAAWTRVSTPNPSGVTSANHLSAVAAQSALSVYAVGDIGYPARSLVLRYNGSAWTRVTVPDYGRLVSVTADATGVWVAGVGVVARYDGRTWTRLPAIPPGSGFVRLTGIAGDATNLWVVGDDQTSYFDGYLDNPYAARFTGGRWSGLPGLGSSYTGVATDGTTAWASSSQDTVTRFSGSTATPEITPAPGRLLNAIAADPAGRQWAVGGGTGTSGGAPAIITAPAAGQGGLAVTTGAAGATVTWVGPVTGSGTTDGAGNFTVGGLPTGGYTVIAALPSCTPGVTAAVVTPSAVSQVTARITCP